MLKLNKRALLGGTAISASLLAIVAVGTVYSFQWESKINETLGVTNVSAVKPKDDTSDTAYFKSEFGDGSLSEKNQTLLLQASKKQCYNEVAEGATLMRNKNGALPLKSNERKITVFGNNATNFVYLPSGGGEANGVQANNMITFKTALDEAGFSVNPTLWSAYENSEVKRHYDGVDPASEDIGEVPLSFYTSEIKSSFASYNDAALIVITRESGEGADMWMNDHDNISKLALHANERAMVDMITSSGTFAKVIVVVNTTNQLELGWLDEYNIDACLWTGSVGQWGASAIPDLLTGVINPSGSLVDTWATNSLSAPSCVNSGTNTPQYSNLSAIAAQVGDPEESYAFMSTQVEGIYVGYRYYETRYEDTILNQGNATSAAGSLNKTWSYAQEMVYPFGHGLSYTSFSESLDKVSDNGDGSLTATVTVKNIGSIGGKKSVLLFAQTPYGDYEKANNVEKSAIQLVQFGKTGFLEPGASETLTLQIDKYLLASYDAKKAKTYILSSGDYYLALGGDVHQALNAILAAKGANGLIDEDGNAVTGDTALTYHWTEVFDATTYAKSKYTGQDITNAFSKCDLNSFFDQPAVTYLSRRDWGGSFPTKQTAVAATPEMIRLLKGDLYEKAADSPSLSSYEIGVNHDLPLISLKGLKYDDPAWQKYLAQYSVSELGAITAEASGTKPIAKYLVPHLRFIDGPMGLCGKLPFGNINCTTYAAMPILAASYNKALILRRGELMGEEGLFGGMHVVNGPGLNLHRTPFNGRSCIYYSEDANLTYLIAEVENQGMMEKGVTTAVKHFVLNDQEFHRQGLSQFFEEQGMREIAMRSFESSLNSTDNTFGSMMSFNRLGCVSDNNCSYAKDIARNEWGFHGFFQTDAAQHYSIYYVTELASGTDLFSTDSMAKGGKAVAAYINANNDGHLYALLKETIHHVHYAIVNGNGMNGISAKTTIVTSTPWWEITEYSVIAALAVFSAVGIGFLLLNEINLIRQKRKDEHIQIHEMEGK